MPAWFTGLIKFIAALMDYFRDRQLMDSGRDKEKLDVLEKSNGAKQKAKQVIKDIDSLPSNIVRIKLRDKYTDPD